MSKEVAHDTLSVGIVGAGVMGRGIAQVAITGGCKVKLFDSQLHVAEEALAFISSMLSRGVKKKQMNVDDVVSAMAKIKIIKKMSEFFDCNVVIEAVTEDLEIKRKIFTELESVVSDDVILVSNTSSLSITTIAAKCAHAERVAGFHFFNPVPLMKLVEVITGIRTEPKVADFLVRLGKRMGRTPIRVSDSPGFLVNQVGRGYTIEAAHLYHDGIATVSQIDSIMCETAGFRMGPFELMDLTGIDITHPATELIYEQFFHEPRFRPSPFMKSRMEGGFLGRKTGEGYYVYGKEKQKKDVKIKVPKSDRRPVWISSANLDANKNVQKLLGKLGAKLDHREVPEKNSLIIVTPLGLDATTAAIEEDLDPKRTVALDTLFSLNKRRTIMKTPVTANEFLDSAHGLFTRDGVPVSVIHDSTGFVSQRILAMIVNIGCAVAEKGVATPNDIDKAVLLGLGYPYGPLAFGDFLGASVILEILESIFDITGDPRYRPTSWLRRRALLGISLLSPHT